MFQDPFTPQYYRRLQQLTIRTRRAMLGSQQGVHVSARKGQGLEFAEYRPYVPGDEFRHIDWGVLARTDKVFVKQFREEQNLTVVLIVDGSASMKYPENSYKYEYASFLALSIACIALSDGDAVQVYILGGDRSPKFRGIRTLPRVKSFLLDHTPEGEVNLQRELPAALAQQKLPGSCFVFSDFLYPQEDLINGLDALRSRNFEIKLIRVAAADELTLSIPEDAVLIDAESGEELEVGLGADSARQYMLALADTIAWLESYTTRYGINHLLVPTNASLTDVIIRDFTQRGILG